MNTHTEFPWTDEPGRYATAFALRALMWKSQKTGRYVRGNMGLRAPTFSRLISGKHHFQKAEVDTFLRVVGSTMLTLQDMIARIKSDPDFSLLVENLSQGKMNMREAAPQLHALDPKVPIIESTSKPERIVDAILDPERVIMVVERPGKNGRIEQEITTCAACELPRLRPGEDLLIDRSVLGYRHYLRKLTGDFDEVGRALGQCKVLRPRELVPSGVRMILKHSGLVTEPSPESPNGTIYQWR